MTETKGVIYILTNPSFPQYVKLGYADDVDKRLVDLNRSECIPFAFRIYATYEVPKRLTDLYLHGLIDKLNPSLRAIDTFNGKPRKKEFYAMSKEDAYSLLEAIAEIHDRTDKLKKYIATEEEQEAEEIAELVEIESEKEDVIRRRAPRITLEEYFENKNPELVELYKNLQETVLGAVDGVTIKVLPQYIAWEVNNRYFAEIHIQRKQIMMLTTKPKDEFSIGKKVPDNFLWALNYRSYFATFEESEEAKKIILESYEDKLSNR